MPVESIPLQTMFHGRFFGVEMESTWQIRICWTFMQLNPKDLHSIKLLLLYRITSEKSVFWKKVTLMVAGHSLEFYQPEASVDSRQYFSGRLSALCLVLLQVFFSSFLGFHFHNELSSNKNPNVKQHKTRWRKWNVWWIKSLCFFPIFLTVSLYIFTQWLFS